MYHQIISLLPWNLNIYIYIFFFELSWLCFSSGLYYYTWIVAVEWIVISKHKFVCMSICVSTKTCRSPPVSFKIKFNTLIPMCFFFRLMSIHSFLQCTHICYIVAMRHKISPLKSCFVLFFSSYLPSHKYSYIFLGLVFNNCFHI